MLKALKVNENRIPEPLVIKDIGFEEPFYEGLEYNPPARGVWNIVHTGMLIPEAHQVYVCAQGCLRGVILTAAEMNSMERMSWVSLREKDMFNGEMESRVIEGCAHIVGQMRKKPRCVLLYLSCMHMFEGCDFRMIIGELSKRFPDIDFIDCYMIPTMRKTMSPDAMMKQSLYYPVKSLEKDKKLAAIIGCDRETDKSSELFEILSLAGMRVWEINCCKTYDEYLSLGKAALCVSYLPVADAAGRVLEKKLGTKWLRLPLSYKSSEIENCIYALADEVGVERDKAERIISEKKKAAKESLERARKLIADMPIAIDFSASPRPLELAVLLAENGFRVARIYTDHFSPEEKNAFERLRSLSPKTKIYPTLDPAMRFAAGTEEQDILCIGQRAAYFCNSRRFVNIVEGGGMYGFDGIRRMGELMTDAYLNKKDTKRVISHKGLGCESCL